MKTAEFIWDYDIEQDTESDTEDILNQKSSGRNTLQNDKFNNIASLELIYQPIIGKDKLVI